MRLIAGFVRRVENRHPLRLLGHLPQMRVWINSSKNLTGQRNDAYSAHDLARTGKAVNKIFVSVLILLLGFPHGSQAQSRPAQILFAGSAVADIVSTCQAGRPELNPLVGRGAGCTRVAVVVSSWTIGTLAFTSWVVHVNPKAKTTLTTILVLGTVLHMQAALRNYFNRRPVKREDAMTLWLNATIRWGK